MFWDKKEKRLPDLPQPQGYPGVMPARQYSSTEDEFEDSEVHELPSFPDSPMKRGFSQAAIKDAVMTEERDENPEHRFSSEEELPALPQRRIEEESPSKFKLTEMEEWSPKPRFEELDSAPSIPSRKLAETKAVFVKIDKFKSARESLKNIESGLQEIEDLLNHIREVKAREDQELSSWEKEMENLKSRISNVITDVFDRVEM